MTTVLGEISEAFIFEPLSLTNYIFEHRFYSFEELLKDTPHILQTLYLFLQGTTVAITPIVAQKTEDLVQELDEE